MPPGFSFDCSLANTHKFTGKELDSETGLGLYYFGARYYDPAIGRWLSVDPMADKYPFLSPYNYVANNPLNIIDPDGRDWYDFGDEEESDIQWREGSDPQPKPGFWNWIKNLFGRGEYAESLGEEVLVIIGQEENEPVNAATFEFYNPEKREGPTATIQGNSIPADANTMRTMAEGLYTDTYLMRNYHGSGINAIAFRKGTVRATNGQIMTLMRVHSGNIYNLGRYDSNGTPWSRGCPTFGYGPNMRRSAQLFGSHFTNRTHVYLRRY